MHLRPMTALIDVDASRWGGPIEEKEQQIMSRRTSTVKPASRTYMRPARRSRRWAEHGWDQPPQQRTSRGTAHKDTKPIARNQLTPGTVVYAHVPFESGEPHAYKTRPCVVASTDQHVVRLLPISSADGRLNTRHRRDLADWMMAGLSRPSSVLTRYVVLDRAEIVDVIGHLSAADLETMDHWLAPAMV